ncbi:hypothetical protein Taro_027979 [Colocasia esculenta]|uniref:Protein kinase domain-containing protein n=1 Tax=Colocasia esculenta TaxID=4460 RepID=A0A843VA35_COLES|nr:hypothetical protein [Colocasia esculenta]
MAIRRPQQHRLPPLLAAVVLLALSAVSHARVCPSCGSTPVPYPLSTASDCGDPSYPIRCDAASRSLFFDTSNGSSYPVLSITPETERLVIRPSPFVPGACIAQDLPTNGLQLDRARPFNITQSNTIFYLNCTQWLLRSPLNCTATSPCHAYVNATAEGAPCRPAPICCTFGAGGSSTSYSLRANVTGCSAYRSFVSLNTGSTPVSQWAQREGVEIQWATPREPLCTAQTDCEAGANATCRADPTGAGGVRRCFCNAGLRWDPFSGTCANNVTGCEATGSCGGSNNAPLIAGLTAGLGAALVVGVVGYLLFKRQRRIRAARERIAKERQDILNANNTSGRSAKNFTGREIKRATGNFSRDKLLGSGGYGDVFKGSLDDGTLVAVKCAKVGNTKSTDQVLNEVRILSQVNHRSLVRLLGCCVELEQPLMVYEFIPNGTLFDHLHGLRGSPKPLTWRHRLAIAHQTAEGLAYLHSSAVPPIYHRDVKSSNILLDEKLSAKVSDFGLSRLAESDLSHISTCAQGTLGYLDPEYYRNYQLTDKSDVYSFGVVLLELLTSQKAIDFNRGPDDVNLAVYVQRRVEEERLIETIDKELREGASQVELDTIKALGFLAVSCLEERRQNRPSMKEVAEEIEYIMSIEAGRAVEERPPKSEV